MEFIWRVIKFFLVANIFAVVAGMGAVILAQIMSGWLDGSLDIGTRNWTSFFLAYVLTLQLIVAGAFAMTIPEDE